MNPSIIKKTKVLLTVVSVLFLIFITRSQTEDENKIRGMYSHLQQLSDGDKFKLKELDIELLPYINGLKNLTAREQALVLTIEGGIKVMSFDAKNALAFLQDAEKKTKEAFGALSPEHLLAMSYLSWAYGYTDNLEMEKNINYELLEIYKKDEKHYANEIANAYHTVAMNYGMNGHGKLGDRVTEQALLHHGIELMNNYSPLPNSPADTLKHANFINLYNSLAISSYATHNYNNAILYANKSLLLRNKYNPNAERAINLMTIGRSLYQSAHQSDSAFFYLDSALAILEKNGLKDSPPWWTYTGYKAEIMVDAGKTEAAITMIRNIFKLLGTNKQAATLAEGYFVVSTIALSKAYIQKGENANAVRACEFLRKMLDSRAVSGNISFVALYSQYAYSLSCNHQWAQAENEFKNAIAKAGYSIDSLKNPKSNLRISTPYEYLQMYWQTGDMFVNKGLTTHDGKTVVLGINILQKTLNTLQRKKQWFFEAGIDEDAGDMDMDISDALLNDLYMAKGLINEKERMAMAFSVIETSKAGLLKSKLYQDNQLASILPDSVNNRRINFKFRIFEAIQKSRETSNWNNDDSIIKAKKDYIVYVQYLRKQYNINELKNSNILTENDPVLMRQNATVINYFLGSSYLYIYTLNNGEKEFIRKSIPNSFNSELMFMRGNCLTKEAQLDNSKVSKLAQIEKGWFQWLLGGITLNKEIIIIPHRQVSFISFEMLDKTADTVQPNYLINTHSVHYELAASFMKKPDKADKNKLAFFGGFASSNFNSDIVNKIREGGSLANIGRDGTETLEGTKDEVTTIAEEVNGTAFVGVHPKDFLDNANKYKVLHISTHALADQGPYHESDLLFESNDSTNGLVRDVQIMQLKLNADMVVLSACNTGVGKLSNSEGVSCLGRSFFLTGCPAVVMSLWTANDASTTKIMTAFYNYLKKGQTKSQALRNAKLYYLATETNPAKKHPYYWAGFIVVGNDDPLDFTGTIRHFPHTYIVWAALIALVICFLFYWRSRFKRA